MNNDINCLQCRYLEIDDYIDYGIDIICEKDIELHKKVDKDTYFKNKDFFRMISFFGHRKENKEKLINELSKAKKCIYFDPS